VSGKTTPEPAPQSAEHDRRIDYIEMPATNIPETKRFYADAFGWKFTDYGPEYTSFEDGRLAGGFRQASEVGAGGPLVVIFAVDLGEVERRVRAAGGAISKPVFSFPGGRRFHFRDPSGNELAVWSDR
jgi:predicted enzyme related to lactoylglutathione lyase